MRMRARNTVPLMVGLVLAAGCGGASDGANETREEAGVFDPLVDTLGKAREVEQEVQQRVDELNKALEEAEGTRRDEDEDTR